MCFLGFDDWLPARLVLGFMIWSICRLLYLLGIAVCLHIWVTFVILILRSSLIVVLVLCTVGLLVICLQTK